jgi:hypothetical protein
MDIRANPATLQFSEEPQKRPIKFESRIHGDPWETPEQ